MGGQDEEGALDDTTRTRPRDGPRKGDLRDVDLLVLPPAMPTQAYNPNPSPSGSDLRRVGSARCRKISACSLESLLVIRCDPRGGVHVEAGPDPRPSRGSTRRVGRGLRPGDPSSPTRARTDSERTRGALRRSRSRFCPCTRSSRRIGAQSLKRELPGVVTLLRGVASEDFRDAPLA
jgi:hypothetical protein